MNTINMDATAHPIRVRKWEDVHGRITGVIMHSSLAYLTTCLFVWNAMLDIVLLNRRDSGSSRTINPSLTTAVRSRPSSSEPEEN